MTQQGDDSGRRGAIVTGGSRGIGAAVALALAAGGYDLMLAYRSDTATAEVTAQACRDLGAQAEVVAVDLADDSAVPRLFATADRHLRRLDLLVNNAGALPPAATVDAMAADRVRRTLAVNAVAPLLCAGEAVRRMSTTSGGAGGVIVNVSSRAAVRGAGGEFVDYAMSKAAVDALTIGLATEVATMGIRVVGVRPGLIDTEMNTSQPGRIERLLPTVPMGRVGHAAEVAEAIRWLASDAAGYITGVTLDVSGGR